MVCMLTGDDRLEMCVGEPVGRIVSALQDRAPVQNYITKFASLVVQVRGLARLLSIMPAR
jgi:hypothetical protein